MVLLDSLLLLLILGGIGVGLYFLIEALKKKKSAGPAGEPSSQNLLGASPEIPACPEGQARSFNPESGRYDGACSPIVEGCMDKKACNYDSSANVNNDNCAYPSPNANCEGECDSGYTKVNGNCVYVPPQPSNQPSVE